MNSENSATSQPILLPILIPTLIPVLIPILRPILYPIPHTHLLFTRYPNTSHNRPSLLILIPNLNFHCLTTSSSRSNG